MEILQICHKPPYPPSDGGTIAMNNITQGLINAGHTVKVMALETPKHPLRKDLLPDSYCEATHIETAFVDTSIKIPSALKSFLTHQSYQVKRFYSNFAANVLE